MDGRTRLIAIVGRLADELTEKRVCIGEVIFPSIHPPSVKPPTAIQITGTRHLEQLIGGDPGPLAVNEMDRREGQWYSGPSLASPDHHQTAIIRHTHPPSAHRRT